MDNDPRLDRPDEPEGSGGAEQPPPPPPDRPGSPNQPSRAESRAAARETDKPPEGTETGGKSETAEPGREREQKPTEAAGTESPLERMPSHSGFANLADEFDARRASREAAQGNGATNEQSSETTNGQSSETGKPDKQTAELDKDAIKEQIDPFAPDLSKTEGYKETFERTARDSYADWTDGVDRIEDLPTGEDLVEDDKRKSRVDRFRKVAAENYGRIDGRTDALGTAIDKAFGPRPTGHAETRVESGPAMADPHQSGIDSGSAASALLATGIVVAESFRWMRNRSKKETDEGHR